MGTFAALIVIGLVMWFFYTKKKQGLNPNEALKEIINVGKPKDKAKVIEQLEAKKTKLAEEAKQVEKIKQLKADIKSEQDRINRAKE